MKSKYPHIIIGMVIILVGILVLLHNLQFIYVSEQMIWGIGFIILGSFFIYFYRQTASKKSILIPGILFFLLGFFTILDSLFSIPEALIGTLVLWITGTIFIAIYLNKNSSWWAVIPGGILVLVGVIVALDAFRLLTGSILWFVFFSGISLIFWFLFLIKDQTNKLSWAIYPAFLIMIFSFFILSIVLENRFGDVLFPISIISCGVYFLIKNARQKTILQTDQLNENS